MDRAEAATTAVEQLFAVYEDEPDSTPDIGMIVTTALAAADAVEPAPDTALVGQWCENVRIKANGRTRYEGQAPYADEAVLAEIERLTGERDRLRAALYQISELGPSDEETGVEKGQDFDTWDDGFCEGMSRQGRIARAALSGDKPNETTPAPA